MTVYIFRNVSIASIVLVGQKNILSLIIEADGRIRRWTQVQEMEGRFLRVILLPDGETVHNAFFDRSFLP